MLFFVAIGSLTDGLSISWSSEEVADESEISDEEEVGLEDLAGFLAMVAERALIMFEIAWSKS